MDNVMYYICYPLGYIMKWCREQVGNYGLAIILFTLVTKLVILPVSVWVHKNSIRMVSIQPQINRLKAKFYGDRERIAEEQTALYRQVGYNPFANSIPLLIQLLLLAAVVYIIKQPLTHVLRLDGSTIRALADALGVSAKEGQLEIVRAAAEGRFSALTAGDPSLAAAVTAIRGLDMSFCGLDLGVEAADVWGLYTLVPVLAGGFSFLLCWVQNRINILQADQSRLNKYGMTVLSVGISLVLGFFCFNLGFIGDFLPLWFTKESYLEYAAQMMDPGYMATMEGLLTWPVFGQGPAGCMADPGARPVGLRHLRRRAGRPAGDETHA